MLREGLWKTLPAVHSLVIPLVNFNPPPQFLSFLLGLLVSRALENVNCHPWFYYTPGTFKCARALLSLTRISVFSGVVRSYVPNVFYVIRWRVPVCVADVFPSKHIPFHRLYAFFFLRINVVETYCVHVRCGTLYLPVLCNGILQSVCWWDRIALSLYTVLFSFIRLAFRGFSYLILGLLPFLSLPAPHTSVSLVSTVPVVSRVC